MKICIYGAGAIGGYLGVQLARAGYNMRIYVPYGKHWYPYFMRRLAERPANIWFVLKNMFKG